ncbi:MAG TPA: cupin domain-containing protein [Thermoanaerobaculia bacterium]|nr:cupin domain-containing protein [Thermoanaerobaculia bacterium]
MAERVLSSPASIPWREVRPGVMASVLTGRLEDAGSTFVVLYRTSAPVTMERHSHPGEERVTVLQGCLEIGFGETEEESRIQALGPGSYAVIPAGVPHFLRCRAGTIVQIHGVGPFETVYAKAA